MKMTTLLEALKDDNLDSSYNDIAVKVSNQTNNFQRNAGALEFDNKGDASIAVTILKDYYSNVNVSEEDNYVQVWYAKIDNESFDVDGLNWQENKNPEGTPIGNWGTFGALGENVEEDMEIKRYSDVVPKENRKYWYFTTHGVQPGSIPKGVNVLDIKDGKNTNGTRGTFVCLDAVLNTDELRKYDMKEMKPTDESLKEGTSTYSVVDLNTGDKFGSYDDLNYAKTKANQYMHMFGNKEMAIVDTNTNKPVCKIQKSGRVTMAEADRSRWNRPIDYARYIWNDCDRLMDYDDIEKLIRDDGHDGQFYCDVLDLLDEFSFYEKDEVKESITEDDEHFNTMSTDDLVNWFESHYPEVVFEDERPTNTPGLTALHFDISNLESTEQLMLELDEFVYDEYISDYHIFDSIHKLVVFIYDVETDESLEEDMFSMEDSYFSREQLDEFSDTLQDELGTNSAQIYKVYWEPDNRLEVDWEYMGYEETTAIKVDMRGVRTIQDLERRYIPKVIDDIHARCEEFEKDSFSDLYDESLKEDNSTVTIGIYGDEVPGMKSVDDIVNYFKNKGFTVSNVDGDIDYGWEMNLTGIPDKLFFAVCNKIPGYNSRSVDDFIRNYSVDESISETVEKHDTLNQKIFNGDELDPDVKNKLLEIVDNFTNALEQDGIKLDIKDVRIIGSNASYNYTPQSDIDLHLYADLSVYPDHEDLAEKVYNAYKSLWNNKYDPVIRGHQVEIYVEPWEN